MIEQKNKYVGVRWVERNKKWKTFFTYRGKRIYMGYYKDEETAAYIVDVARMMCHGTDPAKWYPQVGPLNFTTHSRATFPRLRIVRQLLESEAFPPEELATRSAALDAVMCD